MKAHLLKSSKTFRVFVSSTFSDLKAERNALQERVFPKLRELCEKSGCRFQAIDLRWGVSEEAALDQQAMRICLEEVERCQRLSPRPNFIILLGDRYGWQPLPYAIPASEYDALLTHVDQSEKTLLDKWYKRDDNAVPPVYDLLPRNEGYAEFSAWEPVERELLGVLRKGVAKLNLSDVDRVKYNSSATEQEIFKGALNAPGAKEHVFCFLRQISEVPQDRSAQDFIDLDANGRFDMDAHERLARLKERLRNDMPGNVHKYSDCTWTGTGITVTHLDRLCDDVYAELAGIITQEIASLQQIDSQNQEIADHAAFALERARNFTGRKEIQGRIQAYIKNDSREPLAIFGEGGSGKSSLIAKISQLVAEHNLKAVVISRFIGATPSSTNIFPLLESLCKQIAAAFGKDEAGIPTEYKELVEEFKKRLAFGTAEKPIVLMLDALDQLSDAENAKNLLWLSSELPEHVKLIVSALDPSVCVDQLKRRYSETQLIPLGPMEQEEGEALLDLWLSEAGRVLQPAQKAHLLDRFSQCPLPLYMKLAFEEARQWKSYDDKAEISGEDIQGVILEFLGNLSTESCHGQVMVKHALGYFAAGKNGLTEEELLSLLSADPEVMADFRRRSPKSPKDVDRLPVVVWSRLYLDLKPYLTERSADHTTVMNFFHRQFGEVVRNNFFDAEVNKELHRRIAGYFRQQPYKHVTDGDKLPHYRKVSEIVYQMMQGEMWGELEKTLMDFDYPMAKCMAGMVDELVDDYQKVNAAPVLDKHGMRIWATFFRERAHILRRGNDEWPAHKILLQLAMERADDSPVTRRAEKYLDEGKVDWVWLRRRRRLKEAQLNNCVTVFEGHSGAVGGALKLIDGRILSWSADNTLRLWDTAGQSIGLLEGHLDSVEGAIELHSGDILSWSSDGTLRCWQYDGTFITEFKGHSKWINGALELSDGRILSWSGDTTLRLWDKNGILAAVLEGHSESIMGASELQNGYVLSWSIDCTLRMWDSHGNPIAVLKGHGHEIDGALELQDGRILSWSESFSGQEDSTIHIWDKAGKPCGLLVGHTQDVKGVLELSDGSILSWSEDDSLREWDRTDSCIIVFSGHDSSVNGACELSDGNVLSWSLDGTLRKWDRNGNSLVTFKGHSDFVDGALELRDGRILSWSSDNSLRVWRRDGKSVAKLEGHCSGIEGAIEFNDGHILSWSGDRILRLWDRNYKSAEVLEGHTNRVYGAIELYDNCMLTWSADNTIRVWDRNGLPLSAFTIKERVNFEDVYSVFPSGVVELRDGCLLSWWLNDKTIYITDRAGIVSVELKGHESYVEGALELTNGQILSWSNDKMLRVWNRNGQPVAILKGHSETVRGAREIQDGRILSWAAIDTTFRLWNLNKRTLSKTLSDLLLKIFSAASNMYYSADIVFKGHRYPVKGATELCDGRFISWSNDKTLRLWDAGGKLIVALEGHSDFVEGARELDDGRILSWSNDGEVRLWDSYGKCLECLNTESYLISHPEWVTFFEVFCTGYFVRGRAGRIAIRNIHKGKTSEAQWHVDTLISARLLNPSGSVWAIQENGQVCFLELHRSNKRISLADLERTIVSKTTGAR